MPPKRKAPTAAQGAAKAGRVSQMSTPGPATPRSLAGSDDADSADPNFEEFMDEENFNDGVQENQKELEQKMLTEAEKFTTEFDLFRDKPLSRPRDFRGDQVSGYFRDRDLSYLQLKPDHKNRPMYINPDTGTIILERFNPLAEQAADFLVTIAEPESRPTFLHEYKITMHSLYAAVSVGLNPKDIMNTLDRFLKTPLPAKMRSIIEDTTKSYGKVKLVLKNNKYFVESTDREVLHQLLNDPVVGPLRIQGSSAELSTSAAPTMGGMTIAGTKEAAGVKQAGLPEQANEATEADIYAALNDDDEDDADVVHSFEVNDDGVETVQSRCLELKYPMLSEYDFRNDDVNPNLEIDLRPNTQIRPYQEKSLSKMFGNGRAKSGIIVLPCGAGKTLVGITAACTIKKGVIVLCTSAMSVVQWRNEFLKWSNINPDDIVVFTADSKERFTGNTGIIVTTYSMIAAANSKRVAHDSKKVADFLKGREWGLMLLDEVHVTPAQVFRRVMTTIKSHAKLGLTATLVREDDKISDLNFLIGPKLYEANWMELSQQGHIAKVQCAEVWCPMPPEFYDEYLRANGALKRVLCAMNPKKFQNCEYLIKYHEARGDKIIVFSDELYPLMAYADTIGRMKIHGSMGNEERQKALKFFQHSDHPDSNTVFLSKIGDTSLDLPEATVLIQISSHFGSRRQEAQRLGRILRAKRRNDEGFNAFFYTLVSKDTQEMYYSARRQSFLVDQGYAFKVITQLNGLEKMPNLKYNTPQERRELLQKILVEKEKVSQQDGTDDLFYMQGGKKGGKKTGVRRAAGMLGELSGGQDMAYVEQNKSLNAAVKKSKGPKNAFFKKLDLQKDKLRKAQREGAA